MCELDRLFARLFSSERRTRLQRSTEHVYSLQISGEWKGVTAGGCGNHAATYKNNPRFQLEIESTRNDNYLFIELRGPKQYQVGFDVTIVSVADDTVTAPFKTASSGPYR